MSATKMARRKAPKKSESAKPRRSYRITRVYTRTGDRGTTRLVGGQEVRKDDPRIESYGTVDELGVRLGAARATLEGARRQFSTYPDELGLLAEHLKYIQNLLFTLGGDLATRIGDRWENMPLITAAHTKYLEKLIDAYNAELPPLTDFILAGGGPLALSLHSCRVVCRRCERVMQTLASKEDIGGEVIPFVNRLSDLFFVLARWASAKTELGGSETIWDRNLAEPPLPKMKRRRKM
jgi:cob(I)alamin adenosyltransferase